MKIEDLTGWKTNDLREAPTKVTLDLRAGTINGSTDSTDEHEYVIKIPAGKVQPARSSFQLSAYGVIAVWKGTATITLADGSQATQVQWGNEFDIRTGQLVPLSYLRASK